MQEPEYPITETAANVDALTRFMLQTQIVKRLKAIADEGKPEAAAMLGEGDRKAVNFLGVKLGSVSLIEGRATATVADMPALIEQCEAGDLEITIKPHALEALKRKALAGEDVPGIVVKRGEPYLRATATKEGNDVFDHLTQAALGVTGMKELEQ